MVALGVVLVSCAPAPQPTPPPPPPKTIDLAATQTAIGEMMRSTYKALEEGNVDGFFAHLLPGGFVLGPGTADVAVTKPEAIAGWRALAAKKLPVKSTSLTVIATSDGRAAWISDVVELGRDKPTAVRVSALAVESEGQWWLTTLDWSVGVAAAQVSEAVRGGKLKPMKLQESVASGAVAVVGLYERGLARFEDLLDALSPRNEAVFFGLQPEERMDGGPNIRDVLLEQHKTVNYNLRKLGPVHADVSPNGRMAFVAGPVEVTLPSKDRVPARSLWIYQNEGGLWRLVLAHLSLPVEGVLK
jgi:hypothetical protein